MGLLADGVVPHGCRLTGGVSSDIWRVDVAGGPICAKRALSKLLVATDCWAPVARNKYEARWMRLAATIVPSAVPELLGQDEASGTLVMQYLPPDNYPVWKVELLEGRVSPEFAHAVAATLVQIHAKTAGDPAIATEFATDGIFHDIRLEPYLLAAARVHPDSADALHLLVETTTRNKCALVHGDISPKNILVGPSGPVFLDAECAWWGDPAFDLAFCLNHLLLKCLHAPGLSVLYLACFEALARTYLAGVVWESALELEKRSVHLLPGLLLARIDGKMPVEYVTDDVDKDRVRRFARAMLAEPVDKLEDFRRAWMADLDR